MVLRNEKKNLLVIYIHILFLCGEKKILVVIYSYIRSRDSLLVRAPDS